MERIGEQDADSRKFYGVNEVVNHDELVVLVFFESIGPKRGNGGFSDRGARGKLVDFDHQAVDGCITLAEVVLVGVQGGTETLNEQSRLHLEIGHNGKAVLVCEDGENLGFRLGEFVGGPRMHAVDDGCNFGFSGGGGAVHDAAQLVARV